MNTNRIMEIHKKTAYPESRSVYQALLQVWNECEQESNKKTQWISVKDKFPEPNSRVLIVRDVTSWDKTRPIFVDVANVGFLEKETRIGGPNSLTGYATIKGIYFSVPSILHPDSVTHWIQLPELPKT